jgi:hypothetical protein
MELSPVTLSGVALYNHKTSIPSTKTKNTGSLQLLQLWLTDPALQTWYRENSGMQVEELMQNSKARVSQGAESADSWVI